MLVLVWRVGWRGELERRLVQMGTKMLQNWFNSFFYFYFYGAHNNNQSNSPHHTAAAQTPSHLTVVVCHCHRRSTKYLMHDQTVVPVAHTFDLQLFVAPQNALSMMDVILLAKEDKRQERP